jgi:two-component system, chemotaxis family, chemotaxis protein CheY
MRTLIVEDDFTSRLLLQSLLAKYGECHIAVNGKEAIAAFRAADEKGQKYDLICMDVMMPEMDGQAAVKEIRDLEASGGTLSTHGVKIIMTTALDDVKNVVQSFSRCATLTCSNQSIPESYSPTLESFISYRRVSPSPMLRASVLRSSRHFRHKHFSSNRGVGQTRTVYVSAENEDKTESAHP